MTKNEAAKQIEKLYNQTTQRGEWCSILRMAERTDMSPAEFAAGAIHLARTNDRFSLAPESNTKMLTDMDHAYAIRFGGQDKHIICFY